MTRNLKLGLSVEQIAARRGSLGGSDANILMNGDPAAIQHLWELKTGRAEQEDLSRVLPVQMGSWTEELNRYWYELTTGRDVQPAFGSLSRGFMTCNLDGDTMTEAGEAAIFEAKHVNAFSKIEEVTQRYMPQLHHNMHVAGLSKAILSVFVGTQTHEVIEVTADEWYTAALIDRETAFWECVKSDTPPPGMPAVPAPVPPEKMRTVDMGESNAWAQWASEWRENNKPAKRFAEAVKELKALIEPDVGRAFGHGLQATKSTTGAISFKGTA